jgi:bifunctional DNA-binding transcriptional regulator/antitoxin component of YhaV-PrlF toxin-antitoxin module
MMPSAGDIVQEQLREIEKDLKEGRIYVGKPFQSHIEIDKRVLLPVEILKELGLAPGETVTVFMNGERNIEIRKERERRARRPKTKGKYLYNDGGNPRMAKEKWRRDPCPECDEPVGKMLCGGCEWGRERKTLKNGGRSASCADTRPRKRRKGR